MLKTLNGLIHCKLHTIMIIIIIFIIIIIIISGIIA